MGIKEEMRTPEAVPSYRAKAQSFRSSRRRRIRSIVQILDKLADIIALIEDDSCLEKIEARLSELLKEVSSMVPVRGCLRGGGPSPKSKVSPLAKRKRRQPKQPTKKLIVN